MVMIRPKGPALKVAEKVMKQKGVKINKPEKPGKMVLQTPYLQH